MPAQNDSTNIANEVADKVRQFAGKTHPAALLAWSLVGVFIFAALLFTGFHNQQLYSKGMGHGSFGQVLALVPPLLLDGGIAVLLILLLTYFRSGTLQWYVAGIFNLVLFAIVIFNTSLNFSMNAGQTLEGWQKVYLRWGVLGCFVLALAMYEILIHIDPKHKQRQKKAELNAQAEDALNELELKLIELELEKQKGNVEYEIELQKKMNGAQMAATRSARVDDALLDFEEQEAIDRAKRIRRANSPTGQGNRTPIYTDMRPRGGTDPNGSGH